MLSQIARVSKEEACRRGKNAESLAFVRTALGCLESLLETQQSLKDQVLTRIQLSELLINYTQDSDEIIQDHLLKTVLSQGSIQ